MTGLELRGLQTIASIAPTICFLMGVESPSKCSSDALNSVISAARRELNGNRVERFLVYAPDAVGLRLYRHYENMFDLVVRQAPFKAELLSAVPPVTPVCFASMFTGAMPEAHGITGKVKPVLSCDTLFDALARADKKVAIVAVAGSSIDRIFRQRPVDYFSEDYDDSVTKVALRLIESNRHDFILAYHQEYDDLVHKTAPEGPEALNALKRHITSFDTLVRAVEVHWRHYNRSVLFAPDHGAHMDAATGRGSHGEEVPDDMEVVHFFGFQRAE